MPRSYNGTAANADSGGSSDWAVPLQLVIDGENFNDASFVVGNLQPTIDRLAWLKQHAAYQDLANDFTAVNTFEANVHLDNNATLDVRSGSTAKIDSGGSFTAVSGSNVTISTPGLGNVSIAADFITVPYTNPTSGLVVNGTMGRSGIHAVSYIRQPSIVSTSQHIDCTEDVWRVADTLAANIVLVLDAPPDTTRTTLLTVLRSPRASTGANQQVIIQDTTSAGIVHGNDTAHPTYTEVDGSTSGRWTAIFEWSVGLQQWRVFSLVGAAFTTVAAQ